MLVLLWPSLIAYAALRTSVPMLHAHAHAPPSTAEAASKTKDSEWPLLRNLRKACHEFDLIQPGDKIAVAISGGKDSSTLLYLLQQLKERRLLPFNDWEFRAIHLDQVQPGHDPSSLQEWCEELGVDFTLLREDTYTVVKEKTKPGASYCSLCSRLRRGILYTAAADLGCNRLALGHHRDDALETLLLNMCHQGQLKALPARYVAERGLDVIRPLIYTAEAAIADFATERGFPILPCNLCGSQPDGTPGQRQQMKLMLSALDGMGDGAARTNMLRSLTDVRPTHLLDRTLREACGLDPASGVLLEERGRAVAHLGTAGEGQAPGAPSRTPPPLMFTEAPGLGDHDVYGFEAVELPALPCGSRLLLRELESQASPAFDDDVQDEEEASAEMWRKIQKYVGDFEDDEDEDAHVNVGGEVWPAAAAMCRWLANHTDSVRGSKVLELGTGTGAVGLYAAGLGASRVLLTDGGSDTLLELCQDNIDANRQLFATGAHIDCGRLEWGCENEASATGGEDFDLVLASDCTYGDDKFGAESAVIGSLCRTLSALLRGATADQGGTMGAMPDSGSTACKPRVLLAHEHRSRDFGLPWMRDEISRWDEGDEHLASLHAAADVEGLRLVHVWSERPRCIMRGDFRSWTSDLSILEVQLA